MPTPAPRTVRTSVILPEDAYAQVQAIAEANDVSAAWVIRHAILKLLAQQEGQLQIPLKLVAAPAGTRR